MSNNKTKHKLTCKENSNASVLQFQILVKIVLSFFYYTAILANKDFLLDMVKETTIEEQIHRVS